MEKPRAGWAAALFGGGRPAEQLGVAQPPGQEQPCWTGVSAAGSNTQLWPSTPRENNLGHKFNMTVLTNTISAFIFGFRKGMMALPRNHY